MTRSSVRPRRQRRAEARGRRAAQARPADPVATAARADWTRQVVPLAVVALTLLVFAGAVGNGFVLWDDDDNFLYNPHYRGLGVPQLAWMLATFHLGLWMPLTWMTLGADYVLWGMDPRGYHLTSLLLHAAAAVVFYLVSLEVFRRLWPPATLGAWRALRAGAALASLLFAIHPLRVESVAWVTERRDVLSGALVLCSLLAYLRAVDAPAADGRRRWLGASLGAFALALASKPIVTTLPVVLAILDVYPLRRLSPVPRRWTEPSARRVWLEKLPYLLMSLAVGLVAIAAQRAQQTTLHSFERLGVVARLGITGYDLAFYLWKTLLPLRLAPLYELGRVGAWRRAFVIAAAVVVAVTVLAVLLRRRCPGLAAAWAVNVVMVLPASGLLQNGPQIAADRYTYLPMLGWAALAGAASPIAWRAWSAGRLRPPALTALGGLALAALLALGALTWRQIGIWHDTDALWTHALRVAPSAQANINMSDLRVGQGRLEEGLAHAREAVRLQPGYSSPLVNVGVALERLGRTDEAIATFEQALRISPSNPYAHNNLGAVLALHGRRAEALEHLRAAVALLPGYAQAHANLGILLRETGQAREAEAHLREAERLGPQSSTPR